MVLVSSRCRSRAGACQEQNRHLLRAPLLAVCDAFAVVRSELGQAEEARLQVVPLLLQSGEFHCSLAWGQWGQGLLFSVLRPPLL